MDVRLPAAAQPGRRGLVRRHRVLKDAGGRTLAEGDAGAPHTGGGGAAADGAVRARVLPGGGHGAEVLRGQVGGGARDGEDGQDIPRGTETVAVVYKPHWFNLNGCVKRTVWNFETLAGKSIDPSLVHNSYSLKIALIVTCKL